MKKGQKFVIGRGRPGPREINGPFLHAGARTADRLCQHDTRKDCGRRDPNDRVFRVAECLDPGLEAGGLGKVRFRVSVENG